MSNVILAMCAGYKASQIEPFLRTCKTHCKAKIVLFAYNCKDIGSDLIGSHDIDVVDVVSPQHPEIDRYRFYLDYLQNNTKIQECLMTDIRDVVFQQSPFSDGAGPAMGNREIKLYEEDALFSDAPVVQAWSTAVHGQKELNALLDKPIICSGTTLAGRDGALEYAGQMVAEIERSPTKKFGTDQAIHNHLFYSGALPKARSIKNGYGEVQTLALQQKFTFNRAGVLLNLDGSIPAMLHQYDRHEFLLHHFDFSGNVKKFELAEKKRLRKLDRSRSTSFKHFVNVTISRTLYG